MADEEKKYFKKLTFSNGTEAYVKDDEARNGISTLQGQISALQIADETLINSILDLTDDVDSVVNDMRQIDFSTAVTKGGSGVNSLDDILTYIEGDLTIKPTSIKVTSTNGNIIELSESDAKLYNIDSLSKINVTTSNNQIIDIFFGDGLKDKYILSATPILDDADKPIKVYLEGTPKTSDDYSISNNEITFSDTPYPFGRIKVIYFTNDKKYNYSISDAQQSIDGIESLAIGKNSISNGNYSIAAGQDTVSSGVGSVALGYNTIASGDFQQVFGRNNEEDTENQYIEIVGNGGYKEATKEEIFENSDNITTDNLSVTLTTENLIKINNINLSQIEYDLTTAIKDKKVVFYECITDNETGEKIKGNPITATKTTKSTEYYIVITFYTSHQITSNNSIPIKFDFDGETINSKVLKDYALNQGTNNDHNGGYDCEDIEFTHVASAALTISTIVPTNIKTNLSVLTEQFNNTTLKLTQYSQDENNNKKIIFNEVFYDYFKAIPNFALIVNYTYENSEKKKWRTSF